MASPTRPVSSASVIRIPRFRIFPLRRALKGPLIFTDRTGPLSNILLAWPALAGLCFRLRTAFRLRLVLGSNRPGRFPPTDPLLNLLGSFAEAADIPGNHILIQGFGQGLGRAVGILELLIDHDGQFYGYACRVMHIGPRPLKDPALSKASWRMG